MRGAVPATSAGSTRSSVISAATVTLSKTSRAVSSGRIGTAVCVDDVAGVGLGRHVVQRRAGFALAVQHRPVHRHAPAVLRQQRSVHVERAARRQRQQRARPACAGSRTRTGNPASSPRRGRRASGAFGSSGVMVAMPYSRGRGGDAVEPDGFARIVLVRDDQRHLDAVGQQHLQAAHADVVVGEDDGARHGAGFPSSRASSTARIV